MRDGRKKSACVSLPSTHRAQRRVNCPQRHPLYAQTHPNKHSHVSRSLFLGFFFFPPTIPHAQSIFFSKQRFGVFVFHYNITRNGMRGNGERKRRREERCSKSQEGGIYVDVGEIHHPPSLAFFITEGKQGPPQSLPHHHKYGGEMRVCVCVLGGMHRRRKRKQKKKII